MTAFSKALYYPCISLPNEGWLKNAILYWDGIQTIVPSSIEKPYSAQKTATVLYDYGLLEPLLVDSDMPEINELTEDVLTYLDSREGKEILKSRRRLNKSKGQRIHAGKMSPSIIRRVAYPESEILQEKIKRLVKKPPATLEGWLRVDERFANFYMTLLATRLSDRKGIGLLTDTPIIDSFAQRAKLGAIPRSDKSDTDELLVDQESLRRQRFPANLAQGILANLIVKKIQIAPETPIEEVLEFREKHSDELGFFRTKIAELTGVVKDEQPFEKLSQQVNDIYTNEFIPGFNSFKKALRASKIKSAAETFLKVAFFSTSTTSLPILLGASVPQALLAGVALSLTACAVTYNSNKTDQLSRSPYLYLLKAQQKLQ